MGSRGLSLAPGHPEYIRACVALLFVGAATLGLMYAPQPLLPLIAQAYELTAAQVSWLISAVTAGVAVGVIPLGAASARWGRGRLIVAGLAVAPVAGLAIGVITPWWALVAARFVQGLGIAAVLVSAMAWVVDNVETHAVTRVGALYIAGTTLGGMGGRVLSGGLTELLGTWQRGVLVASLLLAVMGGIAHILLPRARVLTVSANSVMTGDPHRAARRAMYVLGLTGMAVHAGIYNAAAFQGAEVFGLGPGAISFLFLAYAAGTMTAALAGRAASRIPLRLIQVVGVVASCGGVAVSLIPKLWALLAALVLLSAGFFACHALANSTAARLSPQPSAGAARYNFAYYVGASVGAVAFGWAWDVGGWANVVVLGTALLAIAAVVAWVWGPRESL